MELAIVKAQAEVKNINIRTENNGDEKVLAVDVTLLADVSSKEIEPLFENGPQTIASMFDKGGNVLNSLFEMVILIPIENIEFTLDDLKAYKGGKVKKNIRLRPRDGFRFTAKLMVQLSDVTDVRPLVSRLHSEVKLSIFERQTTLALQSVG